VTAIEVRFAPGDRKRWSVRQGADCRRADLVPGRWSRHVLGAGPFWEVDNHIAVAFTHRPCHPNRCLWPWNGIDTCPPRLVCGRVTSIETSVSAGDSVRLWQVPVDGAHVRGYVR